MLDDEIRTLEKQLLTPAVRASREDLDRLLSDGFLEFGKSGRASRRTQRISGFWFSRRRDDAHGNGGDHHRRRDRSVSLLDGRESKPGQRGFIWALRDTPSGTPVP